MSDLRASLLHWFSQHQRDLPWRRTKDPYGIWVSEIMLQQTQVAVVVGYWNRFLERFPTVSALAAAPLPDVLAMWRGLGYYSRARNLHRAAQEIVAKHGGKLPPTAEELLELPGFGRYTAGAVASIAFGECAPLVDGNVARVLSRLFEIEGSPGDRRREAALWAQAESLVQGERPGDFNQGLMELGATVCRVEGPLCLLCPVREHCAALAKGRIHELPPPKVRAARKQLRLCVAVWRRKGAVLLGRRKDEGLFGGLWELPSVPFATENVPLDSLRKACGANISLGEELATVNRTLTHRDLVLVLYEVTGKHRPQLGDGYQEMRFVHPDEAKVLGVSTAMQHALQAAGAPAP